MAYTTVDLVSAELKGLSITSSTTPSTSTVTNWITDAEAEIDLRTGQSWTSTLYTDEVFDYAGNNYIKFPYSPVVSVTSLAYEENGLGADSESWVSLTEGRTNDYIVYTESGEAELIDTSIPSGSQNIKATFIAGYSSVPTKVQRLATLMVAKRVIDATLNSSSQEEGGSVTVGNISISDPTNFSVSQVKNTKQEIDDLFSYLGTSRVFRGNRVYRLRY